MKRLLALFCLLGLAPGTASAAGPDVTIGAPNPGGARYDCSSPGQCQYGYNDMETGAGWTLGMGQQLGILCGPYWILGVGFWSEFVVVPGPVDVYINGEQAGRFTTVAPGENYLRLEYNSCERDACIMLCPVGDTWLVTGEDYDSAPYGNCYWSNDCDCSTAFTDNNLTIWACIAGCPPPPTPIETMTWGRIRAIYR
jgi:hypothetical protein